MSTDVYSVGSGEKCCSSSDSSNGMPEDWEDWENDGWETDRVQCLFSDDTFESVDEAIAHDNEKNGFGFEEYREKVGGMLQFEFCSCWRAFIGILDAWICD